MDAIKQIWAKHLRRVLIRGGGLSGEAICALARRFEATASNPQECEGVFRSLIDQFGNCSADAACVTVREEIEQALKEANKQTVDRNPVSRLATYLSRVQSGVKKMSLEVSGLDVDATKLEGKNITIPVPSFCKQRTFEATAKHRELGDVPMALEVRF